MSHLDQQFAAWAKSYKRQSPPFRSHPRREPILFKVTILIGLAYFVWTDKWSLSIHLSDTSAISAAAEPVHMAIFDTNPAQPAKAQKTSRTSAPAGIHPDACKNYIERFAPVAIAEMRKYGIPASIILAQALLESNAGAGELARNANNHFGIKCFSKNCKTGHCANFSDDTHKDFFVKYPNAWSSFRAHSELLKKSERYAHLFQNKDYKTWANGLKKAGYASDPNYHTKLIQLIEKYQLQRLDQTPVLMP